MANRLSLCLIFKDERDYLEDCFASVRDVCDEFVFIDSGSSDGSTALVKEWMLKDRRVKYFLNDWPGDFAVQRNFALSQATGDWVLVLDADERLDAKAGPLIQRALEKPSVGAWNLTIRNYTWDISEMGYQLSDDHSYGTGYVTTHLHRLFRRIPSIQYEGALHERIEPSLERNQIVQGDLFEVVIHHLGKIKEKLQGSSENRYRFYLDLGLKKLKQNPNDSQTLWEVGVVLLKQGQADQAENYFRSAFEKAPEVEEFERYYLLSLYHLKSLERLSHHTYRHESNLFFKKLSEAERGTTAITELLEYEDRFSQAPLLAYEVALRKGQPKQIAITKEAAEKSFKESGILEWIEGRFALSKKENQKALQLLERALKKNYQPAFKDFCIAALKEERFDEVLKWKQKWTLPLWDSDTAKMIRLAEIKSVIGQER